MVHVRLYNRLLFLAVLILVLGFLFYGWIAPAFADDEIVVSVTPTPVVTPTPTFNDKVTLEYVPEATPISSLTPWPTFTPAVFEVDEYDMPRDLEVLWNKILWYSPLRSENSVNPNPEKIGLLWVIINEYEYSKVINANGEIVEYCSLSKEDQQSYNFTWIYPKDFEKLMMRLGDHDWFRTAVESNQPWHESAVNNRIVHLVYNVWMSERYGLNSGRTVPRDYIYYAFTPDSNGQNRRLSLYITKEDLVNNEHAYTWFLQGTLDK